METHLNSFYFSFTVIEYKHFYKILYKGKEIKLKKIVINGISVNLSFILKNLYQFKDYCTNDVKHIKTVGELRRQANDLIGVFSIDYSYNCLLVECIGEREF